MKSLSLVLSLLALIASDVYAYDCWSPAPLHRQLQNADVVFTGKVKSVKSMGVSNEELGTERRDVTFEIFQVWKGLTNEATTVDADVESLYEYNFKEGQYYLVMGYNIYPNRITMIGCPRVEELTTPLFEKIMRIQLPETTLQDLPVELMGSFATQEKAPEPEAEPVEAAMPAKGQVPTEVHEVIEEELPVQAPKPVDLDRNTFNDPIQIPQSVNIEQPAPKVETEKEEAPAQVEQPAAPQEAPAASE